MTAEHPSSPAPEATPGGRSTSGPDARTERAFDRLAELIADSPHNLVGRRDRELIRSVHIPEGVAVGRLLPLEAGTRWLDLGTGAGLPGLVLALLAPAVEWLLLDATRKKVDAVRSFIRELNLENATAVHGRAEQLAWDRAYRGSFDGVVSRAVARLSLLLPLCRGFLADGGVLAAIKGPHVDNELREAERQLRGLRLSVIHTRVLADTVRPTALVTMRAEGPPPRTIPHRPGTPVAAPRGGRRQ